MNTSYDYRTSAFVDLSTLHTQQEGQAQLWMEELLSDKAQLLPFSPDSEAGLIQHLYTSARNRQRKYGASPLGVGFPFLILPTTDRLIAAPLLIWPLLIEPEALGVDQWYLSVRENKPVVVNQGLCALLQAQTGLDLGGPLKALGPRPTWSTLREVLSLLTHDFPEDEPAAFRLTACPSAEIIGNATGPTLVSAAAVGIFPLWEAPMAPEATPEWPAPTSLPWSGHPFGAGALDPHQANAAEGVRQEKYATILGGQGAGKKYLAAHLLTNALSNGHKCMVISNSLYPLKELQQQLSLLGLGHLLFTLRDAHEDYPMLLDFIRAETQAERQAPPFDPKRFHLVTDKLLRHKDRLDKAYGAVRSPILGKHNWTNIAGQFLQSNRREGKELLGAQLNPADFRFEEAEYSQLIHFTQAAFPLFQRVKSLDHPLSALHPALFLEFSKSEALALADHKIRAYEKRTSGLLHRYITRIHTYSDQLRSYLEEHYRKLSLQSNRIADQFRDYALELGDAFLSASDGSLRLSAPFSSKNKNILAAREQIRQSLESLRQLAGPLLEFGLEADVLDFPKPFKKLEAKLKQSQEQLAQWRQELPTYVQEETLRLSSTHLHERIIPGDLIVHLEKEMDLLLEEINHERLLQQPLEHRLLTLAKREKFLENLGQTLETLRLSLRDFAEFYDWQRLWLSIPGNGQKLIRALANLKPRDWTNALQSWYLDQTLLKHQTLALPQESLNLSRYEDLWREIQEQLPAQILDHWGMRKLDAQKQISRNKPLSNLLSGKGKTGSREETTLSAFFNQYGATATDVFPVILTTTQAALQIFRDAPGNLFEWVVFLEAQHMQPTHILDLMPLGQRLTAFANPLTAPANEAAHPVFDAWPCFPLQTVHRLYGLNPLQLLNAAHIPDEAAGAATQTLVHAVEGLFNEPLRINIAESDTILDFLLHQLSQQDSWTAPSISIVAFTPEQRNHLAAQLLQLKRSPGQDAERIQQLERNGLGIYTLDELEEVHSDIVLVSATFGPAHDGSGVSARFPELAAPGVLRQLYMLLGIAKRQTLLFHSLPPSLVQSWSHQDTASPEGFLSNFLLLAADTGHADSSIHRSRLERFAALAGEPPQEEDLNTAFWDALAEILKPYIAPERIKRHFAEAQFRLPLVIAPADPKKPYQLLCADGFWGVTPHTDYIWEQAQRKMLAENGFQTVHVWSVNWWKQAEQEARRLAGQLIRSEQLAES